MNITFALQIVLLFFVVLLGAYNLLYLHELRRVKKRTSITVPMVLEKLVQGNIALSIITLFLSAFFIFLGIAGQST